MVASSTAGKYGVKNTSGRIWASPQRAPVENARQIATGEWTLIKPFDPRNYDEDEDAWDDGYELGEDGSVWER